MNMKFDDPYFDESKRDPFPERVDAPEDKSAGITLEDEDDNLTRAA